MSGWADNYSEAVPRLLAGLTCPRKGLIGPWGAFLPAERCGGAVDRLAAGLFRWFDHWLRNIHTGIMEEPMLRVWMQDSAPPRTCYRHRPGRWVAEDVWPSPRIDRQKLFLNEGGALGTRAGRKTKLSVCSPLTVGTASGEIGRYGEEATGPPTSARTMADSPAFLTAPLGKPVEILGAARLRLNFSCDKRQALVAVRLCDIAPDGSSTRVTLGLLNLTHRDSHERPAALEPGKTYTTSVGTR